MIQKDSWTWANACCGNDLFQLSNKAPDLHNHFFDWSNLAWLPVQEFPKWNVDVLETEPSSRSKCKVGFSGSCRRDVNVKSLIDVWLAECIFTQHWSCSKLCWRSQGGSTIQKKRLWRVYQDSLSGFQLWHKNKGYVEHCGIYSYRLLTK